jgi:hypothetical protein
MKLIIKKTDLLKTPCAKYKNLPNQFDAIEEIAKRGNISEDVRWLIKNCKLAQTNEMLEYYKSLNPSFDDVSWVIKNCKFAQTPEILEYYKSLKPSFNDVRLLIESCELAQTPEMLKYLESLKK